MAILYAFGSRAAEARRWLHGEAPRLPAGPSDLDIGVRPAPGTYFDMPAKARLAIALEDLTGAARVDLVLLPEAGPFLALEIVRGERLYAASEYEADEYDLYVLWRAGDLAPLERERSDLILREEP